MARVPTFTQDMDLVRLIAQFGTEDKCRDYLIELRWPNGVHCPRCSSTKISRIYKRNQFDCDSCRYQFSVTVGTIFHDTHLPLWKWFLAVYLVGESKKGISANRLKRMLKVSYKTAWYLGHRIRAAMHDANPDPLRGIIEAEEMYVGPVEAGEGRRVGLKRRVVLGAVEREGDIRFRVTDRADRATLHDFLRTVVHDDAKAIYTDDWKAYDGIGDENTVHATVNHGQREWVQGDVQTNTIEGMWNLFRRSVVGSHHHLSIKHLASYLDEIAFRYNERENAFLFRDTMLALVGAAVLPYEELIA